MWGNKCKVLSGNSSQIISYPADPNGVQATTGDHSGTFVLTAGEYYTMRYRIMATNYLNQHQEDITSTSAIGDKTDNTQIYAQLFDHDGFVKISRVDRPHPRGSLGTTGLGSVTVTLP